jgi:putative endonuclease
MRGGWLYIMTNRRDGVLYTGVSSHLAARVEQHRTDRGSEFCRRYGLNRLEFAQRFDTIEEAIAREKQVKAWRRAWKIALIESVNTGWDDLYERIA